MAGFDAGADDYITKPIKPKLLVSKVKALLRWLKEQEKSSETLNVGGIEINREEYNNKKQPGNRLASQRVRIVLFVGFKAWKSVQARRNFGQGLGKMKWSWAEEP